jgi:polyhydroxybutyrate depolymerase
MRTSIVALAIGCAVSAPIAGVVAQPPADIQRTVAVSGRSRAYLLHAPPGKPAKPRALVLVFHGGASNAPATVRLTGFNDLADREDFLVAYPSGSGRLPGILTWNAGACCGYAAEQRVDDVAFVRALLADVATVTAMDATRVYATGISNGGQMAYRLAAEMPDRIAAIAPVAGSLEVLVRAVSRPVSVMHFHGTNDENLPMAGGRGRRSIAGVAFQSVQHSVGAWIKANGCQPSPAVERIPDRVDDGTRVERRTYPGCRRGSEVVLYVIEGGGHTWPGRQIRGGLLGVSTREIMATDLMWQFFARHATTEK